MDETPSPTPPTPEVPRVSVPVRHLRRAVTIYLIVTAALLAIFLLAAPHFIEWGILPPGASDRAGEIDNVMWLFTLLSIPVFALVVVFSFYGAFVFGSRVMPRSDAPSVIISPRLQTIWLVASILLVAFLYVYGLAFLGQVDAKPGSGALQVNVTGEQWLWNYSYPQYGNVYGTTLVLPVNRPVTFTINSIDVQHSFWIPAFGIKQDAVPGETTHVSVTPKQIGDYVVRCAELCGLYHAYMETPVHVVSAEDFDRWVASQPTPEPSPTPSAFSQPDIAFIGSSKVALSGSEG
ncbi:MAG: cytochrome c oxidase subunit II [Ktedonobacterales bacterium]